MNKKILYVTSITVSIVLGSITGYMVIAQETTTHKIFTKDFCINETNLLDDILYPNGEQLSYDSSGCPISTKVIHRWNELTTQQKTLITITT